jgi:hypothetical protein
MRNGCSGLGKMLEDIRSNLGKKHRAALGPSKPRNKWIPEFLARGKTAGA